MSDSDLTQINEMMSREMTEADYLNALEQKLEREIKRTPPGRWENLLVELNILFKSRLVNQLELVVLQGVVKIAQQALAQWRVYLEENQQEDIININNLEALKWKKLNIELQGIKSNLLI